MQYLSFPRLASLLAFAVVANGLPKQYPFETTTTDLQCPLPSKVPIPDDVYAPSLNFFSKQSRKLQVERMQKALQVATVTDDSMAWSSDDPRFEAFKDFHKVLKEMFPLTHAYARLDIANKYGLVYTFNGTNPDLKPMLLAAHQDTLPPGDLSEWTHPPFSGHYDGKMIWGRGASDCKNNLIGILSSVEVLLKQSWEPTRSLVLAFGFDEEIHGNLGAGVISEILEKAWGKDGFELILDEGGTGLETVGDAVYAQPAVGEKGYVDILVTVNMIGGHSSMPPAHTGVGILAEVLVEMEKNPFTPYLPADHPTRKSLECQAKWSSDTVEPWLPEALASDDLEAAAAKIAESRGKGTRFRIQTSQAADLIRGGTKINALPEEVVADVDYRVAIHESYDVVKKRVAKTVAPIAEKHNISFVAYGNTEHDIPGAVGLLNLTTHAELAVAPISPTDEEAKTWQHFAGIIRQSFEALPKLEGKTVVPVGDLMTGNTDTRYYWDLTRNIYRWTPSRDGTKFNAHAIDERIEIEVHLEGLRFYYDLILGFDTWAGVDPKEEEAYVEL